MQHWPSFADHLQYFGTYAADLFQMAAEGDAEALSEARRDAWMVWWDLLQVIERWTADPDGTEKEVAAGAQRRSDELAEMMAAGKPGATDESDDEPDDVGGA